MESKNITYKIAMWSVLVFCAFLIFAGIAVWFLAEGGFIAKLTLSMLSITPGVAFGAMAIHELFGW